MIYLTNKSFLPKNVIQKNNTIPFPSRNASPMALCLAGEVVIFIDQQLQSFTKATR